MHLRKQAVGVRFVCDKEEKERECVRIDAGVRELVDVSNVCWRGTSADWMIWANIWSNGRMW